MSHYKDLSNAKEKVIHILYAGYLCDYYEESIIECINEFGEKNTAEAIKMFKEKYKDNMKSNSLKKGD